VEKSDSDDLRTLRKISGKTGQPFLQHVLGKLIMVIRAQGRGTEREKYGNRKRADDD
jgi:hypothetical protein